MMKMTKFTKGPWYLKARYLGKAYTVYAKDPMTEYGEQCLALISRNRIQENDEKLANANLIAAAPDMYEILEDVLNDTHVLPSYLNKQIEKALKKARGET